MLFPSGSLYPGMTTWPGSPLLFSYNSLIFGAGTDIQLIGETGIRMLPATRSGNTPRGRQDGSNAGLNFLSERVVTITLSVTVTSQNPFQTVLANMAAAFQPVSDPTQLQTLQFMYPGWVTPRQLTGRVTNAGFPVDIDYNFNKVNAYHVEITCPDPVIYDSVLQAKTTSLPSPVSGLAFPVTFPASFGSSTGGYLPISNAGNYPTSPVFVITGPVSNPTLLNSATGQFFRLNLTLGATDALVIDMGAKTVVLNGTAARFNAVATGSSWFTIQPGTWTVGVASTDSAIVAATFTAQWRSAWSHG
ncbi:phage distal tail protein [Subtercola vilae]|uniref:Siphovirus-type tail component C-terminal domain-containing protein n=1 Tax=Subtercola vilae TaxID=2056433 RepID=A0A4T2BZB0_9MICO|nr:phage tail domain-containing protein [Subtercola vilae]TIH34978.1 hypothetical protein D4765_11840 [Subtercola vilae]